MAEDKADTKASKTDKADETGFMYNDDGSIIDTAAREFYQRQLEHANTPPNERSASERHADTTPAGRDENSPDDHHSDGGSTLWTDEQAAYLEDIDKNATPVKDEPKSTASAKK